MPTVDIIIDVAGEAAGAPSIARSFAYSKIAPAAPLVTLSLDDVTGITAFLWEIVSQPQGASAVLSSTVVASPTFTPTALKSGTYLIQCTANVDVAVGSSGLAFLTENQGLRKPAAEETTEFHVTRGWEPPMSSLADVIDAQLHAITLTDTGTPDGVASGVVGQFYFDTTNKILYVNHDGATGWYVV